MFNPNRLTIARKRRGLTKIALAQLASLTPQSISEYERGNTDPSEDTLRVLARVLRFPEAFFTSEDLELPSETGVSFRGLASMTSGQRDRALAAGALAIAIDGWISREFKLPLIDLVAMDGITPEGAAEALRTEWGLGERRCPNLVHLLESRGVRVYSLPRDSRTVHAFSFWHDRRPFVFLTTDTTPEKGRFDAAHELGHLVLHSHGGAQGRRAEDEANRFASAFLMPRASILAARLPSPLTLDNLFPLRPKWNVSIGALVHGLYGAERITEWQYRTLCIEISQRGLRKHEDSDLLRETSQVFPKVFAALGESPAARGTVARDLAIRTTDLDALTFGLVVTDGDGEDDSQDSTAIKLSKPKAPQLTLVANKDPRGQRPRN